MDRGDFVGRCSSSGLLPLVEVRYTTAALSAAKILPDQHCPSSAAIDSLTFKSSVLPGEVVIIRAVVVKTWDSSVEVYSVAMAEDRNSPVPTTRFVSDSFFTLVRSDPCFASSFQCSWRG